jgi:drug/metabolite transporter (DMT)-like permease
MEDEGKWQWREIVGWGALAVLLAGGLVLYLIENPSTGEALSKGVTMALLASVVAIFAARKARRKK